MVRSSLASIFATYMYICCFLLQTLNPSSESMHNNADPKPTTHRQLSSIARATQNASLQRTEESQEKSHEEQEWMRDVQATTYTVRRDFPTVVRFSLTIIARHGVDIYLSRNCTKHGVECEHSLNFARAATEQSCRVAQRATSPAAQSSPISSASGWQDFQRNISAQSFADDIRTEASYPMYEDRRTMEWRVPVAPQYTVYQPYLQEHQIETTWQNQRPWTLDSSSQAAVPNGEAFGVLSPFNMVQEYPVLYDLEGLSMHYWPRETA